MSLRGRTSIWRSVPDRTEKYTVQFSAAQDGIGAYQVKEGPHRRLPQYVGDYFAEGKKIHSIDHIRYGRSTS